MKGKTARRERKSAPLGGVSPCAVVATAIVCVLVLLQGGYYPGATCAVALVSVAAYLVWSLLRKDREFRVLQSLLVLALACAYLLSTLVHGASSTELSETAMWFAIAGMSLWCVFGSRREKQQALKYLSWAGVFLSLAGMLMFFGLLPMEGSMSAGRLMFTFQYANTAGLFFGIAAVLCLCVLNGRLRVVALVPVAALLLTQSVGSIAVFLAALVAVGVRYALVEKPRREVLAGAIGAAIIACVAGVLLLRERFAQAASTFIERLVQMIDASSLLAGNPLLGIGPDQWQVVYPAVQTAQYQAADVHCSYLQIGLDAGILGLAILVAILVTGIARLVRAGDFASIVCAAMIAVHALFDFDLQFSSIALLVCLVLDAPPKEAKTGWSRRDRASRAVCMGIAACALVASLGGIWLDRQVGALQESVFQGKGEEAYELLKSDPLLRDDALMQGQVAGALFFQGDYRALEDLYASVRAADSPAVPEEVEFYCALGKVAGDPAGGGREALADVLHSHPYDVELYQAMRAYLLDAALGDGREACVAAYNEQAARANELAREGHAAWIGKHEEIELIGGDDA